MSRNDDCIIAIGAAELTDYRYFRRPELGRSRSGGFHESDWITVPGRVLVANQKRGKTVTSLDNGLQPSNVGHHRNMMETNKQQGIAPSNQSASSRVLRRKRPTRLCHGALHASLEDPVRTSFDMSPCIRTWRASLDVIRQQDNSRRASARYPLTERARRSRPARVRGQLLLPRCGRNRHTTLVSVSGKNRGLSTSLLSQSPSHRRP